MRTPARLALLLACATACSQPPPEASGHDSHTRSVGSEAPPVEREPGADRMLDARATFADLVRNARALASRASGARSNEGSKGRPRCLLRRSSLGIELFADVMPALDPTPDPPSALDSRLDDAHGRFDVLTAWGVASAAAAQGAPPELVLAAFTATAPESLHGPRSLLALGAHGAYLRGLENPGANAQPMPIETAVRELALLPRGQTSVLYITAEATLPVSQIVAALEELPPELAVALAVLLPEGTTLPTPSTASENDETLVCAQGLPEAPADAALGDLDPAQLGAWRAELHRYAERCLEAAGAHAPTTSVRTTLAIRLGDEGAPIGACVMRSEPAALDPALARCLTQAARALPPVTLTTKGLIDLHVPLALHAERPKPLTAGCPLE